MTIELGTAADQMARLVAGVTDQQLEAPTPCPDLLLGDLLDHVGSLTVAFAAAAAKQEFGPPPAADSANLEPGWRDRIARDLTLLVEAWQDPAAWEGMATAGGLEMPAEVACLVALDELVVYGWDVAVASGQPYEAASVDVEVATSFVESFDAPRDGNLFGPVVDVADDADPVDRLIGLTGRDPRWRP